MGATDHPHPTSDRSTWDADTVERIENGVRVAPCPDCTGGVTKPTLLGLNLVDCFTCLGKGYTIETIEGGGSVRNADRVAEVFDLFETPELIDDPYLAGCAAALVAEVQGLRAILRAILDPCTSFVEGNHVYFDGPGAPLTDDQAALLRRVLDDGAAS